MKVAELEGAALDWAVGLASKKELRLYGVDPSISARTPGLGVVAPWRPSYYWKQGGLIVDRFLDNLFKHNNPDKTAPPVWCAVRHVPAEGYTRMVSADGPTPLIAAMRCYVLSELGSDVDVPKELLV